MNFFLGFLFGGWYFFFRWFFFVLDSCDVSACVDWLGNERKKETKKWGPRHGNWLHRLGGLRAWEARGKFCTPQIALFVFASGTLAAVDLQRKSSPLKVAFVLMLGGGAVGVVFVVSVEDATRW